jgi:hypothetical protein
VLEDLVIETVYLGLLKAKIDQDSERVRVFDFQARDAKREDLVSGVEKRKEDKRREVNEKRSDVERSEKKIR